MALRDWPMSCTWLSPWLMLSPLNCLRDGRGIGDVNRSGVLAGCVEASNGAETGGMLFHCVVDLVSVKGENDRSVAGGVSNRGGVVLFVALVDGLSKRDSSECDKVWIDRGLHQDWSAR